MNFFADRMKDFAEAARPTQVSQAVSSGNTRSGQGRGEDSPSAARDDRIAFEEFKKATGRSDTNPYGDAGRFGSGADYSNNLSQGQIDKVNRQAYNQYLGLVSGRGTQRGGIGDFIPGYAPALKLGSNTPGGTVVAAPNQPKQGGIADFFNLSPTFGLLRGLFGGGNTLRALDDGGEDIETLDVSPLSEPTPGSGVFTLVGAQQPRKTNNLFNLERYMPNVPKGGVGDFINTIKDKFKVGPGSFGLDFNRDKGQVGVNYKIQLEKGGEVPAGEGLFSKEELARQEKISAAELQPDGSLPGVDTLRHATPEEVEIGSYNFLKDLEDSLRYHIKERDKVNPFEFSGITRDRKIFHQRQVEDLQERIQDFSSQRAAAVVNYKDYITAGGYPLIVDTEEEPYFTGFNPDLINFKPTNP